MQNIYRLQKIATNPLLVKKKENLFYLTGHDFDARAEEYLLITKKQAIGFGSGLEQINWIKKTDRLKNIGKYLKGYKQLDIEYGFTYGEGKYIKSKLQIPNFKVKPDRSAVDVMRQVKEPQETAKIKKSMGIVEQVFKLVRKEIKKPEMTERKLADFIQSMGLKMGAEDLAFPAIVACGPNAAIPHHVPGNYRLRPNQSIIIDFGFKYKKYCSDFTRTVFLKSAPKKLAEAYNQVEKAYLGAMEYVSLRGVQPTKQSYQIKRLPRPSDALGARNDTGVTGNDVYQKSVDILAQKKLDKYFIHSLGHGTGLEIHELPNLSPKSKDILINGCVFSIEPGVYFPKVGGIRIEDLVYLERGKVNKFINVSTKLEDNIF